MEATIMSIALSKEKVQAFQGINFILTFVIMMIVNVVVLLLANLVAPNHVVLGTYSITPWWATYHSMFKLSVVTTLFMPLVTFYEWKYKTIFSPKQWLMTYFVVNLVMIWEITRFAQNLGFGVSSFLVVVILAAVFNFAQGMAMMFSGKYMLKV